jgi:hypothetical protein
MSKEQTNYRVVRELLSFATATEGDLNALSNEEVNERLQSQGIDPQKLAQATQRKLKMLRNEIAAKRAMEQAEIKSRMDRPQAAINGLAFAARAEDTLSEEDQAMLARYTQPDIEEDGTQD